MNPTATLAFVPDTDDDSAGWLCVRLQESEYMRPEMVIDHWPIQHGWRTAFEIDFPEIATGEELRREHDGVYVLAGGLGCSRPNSIQMRLRDGGRTESILRQTEPIPCPSVRAGIRTEYRQGRWWKLLKSGAVPIT